MNDYMNDYETYAKSIDQEDLDFRKANIARRKIRAKIYEKQDKEG